MWTLGLSSVVSKQDLEDEAETEFRPSQSAPFYRHWGSVQAVRLIGEVLFLDKGTRRGWGVSVTPRPLFTLGKDPIPIVQEAEWTPGPVWTGAENLAPTGIRSPDRPARSQSLYRLRYPALRPSQSFENQMKSETKPVVGLQARGGVKKKTAYTTQGWTLVPKLLCLKCSTCDMAKDI